jgi:hypothetical protein
MSAFWQIHALPAKWTACPHETEHSREAWMTSGIHLKNNKVMKCGFMGNETKQQLLQWISKPSSHQKRQDMFTHMWQMLFLGGGNHGIVHYEFAPQSQTVTQHHYTTLNYTLQCLQEMHDKNDNKSVILGCDFSTITMHLFTLFCLCMNFWLETKWLLFHTLPTDPHQHCVCLFSFPKAHDSIKQKLI